MEELRRLEESEELVNDVNKLRHYEKEIKLSAQKKYDQLHSEFVDLMISKGEVTMDQFILIKRVFDFIKSRA